MLTSASRDFGPRRRRSENLRCLLSIDPYDCILKWLALRDRIPVRRLGSKVSPSCTHRFVTRGRFSDPSRTVSWIRIATHIFIFETENIACDLCEVAIGSNSDVNLADVHIVVLPGAGLVLWIAS